MLCFISSGGRAGDQCHHFGGKCQAMPSLSPLEPKPPPHPQSQPQFCWCALDRVLWLSPSLLVPPMNHNFIKSLLSGLSSSALSPEGLHDKTGCVWTNKNQPVFMTDANRSSRGAWDSSVTLVRFRNISGPGNHVKGATLNLR